MTKELARLALDDAVLRRPISDGNITRNPESHYLDFVIDGQPLAHRLPVAPDMTTLLNRAWLHSVEDSVSELLGKRPAAGISARRVYLYVCGECGDIGCGAITAALAVKPDWITWRHFAWENGYDPVEPIESAPASISFETADYAEVLASAYSRVAALPYDELARQARKFVWRWQWGRRIPKHGR